MQNVLLYSTIILPILVVVYIYVSETIKLNKVKARHKLEIEELNKMFNRVKKEIEESKNKKETN